MRTKSILAAAAIIAAGAASSQAQSNVYSLNVVGYVNTVVEGGGTYSLLANPLNNTSAGGNNSTNLFSTSAGAQQDTAQILTWDVVSFDFTALQPSFGGGVWTANVPLPVGTGFFYVNPGNTFTNTFVGEVVQGSFTNFITGSGSYNSIGSSVPVAGSFTNAISGLVPSDTDQVLAWDKVSFDFQAVQPSFGGGVWTTTALQIGVGEGLFYVNTGADKNWVRNFTVQ